MLTGTPKQIDWAERIKNKGLLYAHQMESGVRAAKDPEWKQAVQLAIRQIEDETDAGWFIARRDYITVSIEHLAERLYHQVNLGIEPDEPEVFCADGEAYADAVIIRAEGGASHVRYPADPSVKEVLKRLGYTWSAHDWVRDITVGCASLQDVIAHTANDLVAAGYAVNIADAGAKELLHTDTWMPINPREIDWSSFYRNFRITFERYDSEEIHDLAMSLPHAIEHGRAICVPGSSAEALIDFADTLGFVLTNEAKQAAEALVAKRCNRISPRKTAALPTADSAALRRNEVLDDLIDAI